MSRLKLECDFLIEPNLSSVSLILHQVIYRTRPSFTCNYLTINLNRWDYLSPFLIVNHAFTVNHLNTRR